MIHDSAQHIACCAAAAGCVTLCRVQAAEHRAAGRLQHACNALETLLEVSMRQTYTLVARLICFNTAPPMQLDSSFKY